MYEAYAESVPFSILNATSFGPPGCAYGILGTPVPVMIVGRPVSNTQSVSGLVIVLGVMKSACTLINPELLALPNSMPLKVVLSFETGRFVKFLAEAGGKGSSAVVFTTTPSV